MARRGGAVGVAGQEAVRVRRITRRNLRTASVPEILEWLGRERIGEAKDGDKDAAQAKDMSRKEVLGRYIWQQALLGKPEMIRLMLDYVASKPAPRASSEAPGEPLAPFTADEAAEAARQLDGAAGPA